MTEQSKISQIRYLSIFLPLVAMLLVVPVWAKLRLADFRETPIDFRALAEGEFINSEGLTRDQLGALKIGFAEGYDPPDIGLFGNHQFQYFNAEAFSKSGVTDQFFNYWHANLSLYDVYDFLSFLADKGKLPRRLVLVQVTSPNNDNGGFIIGRSHEMPQDIAYYTAKNQAVILDGFSANLFDQARKSLLWMKDTYSYTTLAMGLFLRDRTDRLVDLSQCKDATQVERGLSARLARYLPAMLARYMGTVTGSARYYCNPTTWAILMGRDGAYNSDAVVSRPQLDANPLDPQQSQLTLSRLDELSSVFANITRLGNRHGVKVAFIVPPVYETERYSVVDAVFDKATEPLKPEVVFVDHRTMTRPRELFINYDHPGPRYFDALVQDLLKRGLVEPSADKNAK